ncbi:MAG: hypothetical protein CSA23_01475 [Deltaproteobacteria bacterium]|nr:MAG: hypothetical protein CSA23_01475 [Deltaproteobacteria bacterium]
MLNHAFLNQIVSNEQKYGHQGHLVDGKRQDRHGHDTAVYTRQQSGQQRQHRHGRQAEHPHERFQDRINMMQPSRIIRQKRCQ